MASKNLLTEEQHQELLTISRSLSLEHRFVKRVKIILMSHTGKTMVQIQSPLDMAPRSVNKWR